MRDIETFEGIFEQAFRHWVATRSESNEGTPTPVEPVMTVPEFCQANRISLSHFHKLKRLGKGPREIHAGGRVLISPQANHDWRVEREKPPKSVNQEAA